MSTAPRTAPYFTLNLADSQLKVVHLRRRRRELASAPWRVRLALAVALAASHVEARCFALLARREGVAR